MDISSLIKAIFDPQLNKSTFIQDIVKVGDVLSLRIVDLKDANRALVDFGKFRALAEIKFPAKEGAQHLVKVTDTDGQLRLQLIDPESKVAAGRKNIFSQIEILSSDVFNKIQFDIKQAARQMLSLPENQLPPEPIRQALAFLDTHFKSIDLNQSITKWLPLLKFYIDTSGVFFEKNFADIINKFFQRPPSNATTELARSPEIRALLSKDLKPILLVLKEFLASTDSESKFFNTKSLSRFKGSIDMLLADITHQQIRAAHKHNLPDPHHVFSFALPLKENQQKAQLKLYYPKKKKNGSKSGFKISLLLDMDRIGEVRTDFFLLKKDLSITFFVKDDASKKTFEDNFSEITDRLDALFDYIIIKTVVSEKKIQDFHREDLDLTRDRQIDLRI